MIDITNKGWTFLGVFIIAGIILGAGLTAFVVNSFNEPWKPKISEVRHSERIWSEASAYDNPEEIETKTIIETYEENPNSGYSKTAENTVLWENGEAFAEVTPHTCQSFHCEHIAYFRNKIEERTVNWGFLMPPNAVNIKFYREELVERTRPVYYQEERSEWVEASAENNTEGYWRNWTETIENGTETYMSREFVDRTNAFASISRDGTKIVYTTNYLIGEGDTNKVKFVYDIPPKAIVDPFGGESSYGTSGKWEMYIWEGDFDTPTRSIKLDPWFNTSYANRFKITNNATKIGELNVTDFPAFYNLTNAPAQFWSNVRADGFDVLVTQGETTEIFCELVGFNKTSQVGELHLRGNFTNTTNRDFYVYYNNPSQSAKQCNDTQTWNSNYKMVQHLNQNPSDTAPQFIDSTSNDFDGTSSILTGNNRVKSQIYNGTSFTAVNQVISMGTGAPGDNIWASGGTVTFWAYTRSSGWGDNGMIVTKADSGVSTAFGWEILTPTGANSTHTALSFDVGASTSLGTWNTGLKVPLNQFVFVAVTYDKNSNSNDPTIYLNGQALTLASDTNPVGTIVNDDAQTFRVGLRGDGGRTFDGILDEIKLYDQTLSSGWIQTEFNNGFNATSFWTTSGQEAPFNQIVNLNSPTDGFVNSTTLGATPFIFTPLSLGNSTSFFINASLWTNQTGTFAFVSANTSALVNNTQSTILNTLTDGIYIWNVRLCGDDVGVQCVFNSTNRTYYVDTVVPNIKIQRPTNGESFSQNTSIPLNFTVTDATSGVNTTSCLRSIDNGANVSVSSCANTTFTLAPQGLHNITIYASDNGGLQNKTTHNFSWFGLSNFTFRDSTSGALINPLVIITNGTSTNSTTAVSGFISYNWTVLPKGAVNITAALSGYATNNTGRTINEFTLFNETIFMTQAGLELRVRDEKTNELLRFNVSISNSSTTVSFTNQTVLRQGIANLTVGTSTIEPMNFTGGYEQRFFYQDLSLFTFVNRTVYLLKTADSIDETFFVKTFGEIGIEGALITVNKTISSQSVTVAQAVTDTTGTATIPMDPTVTYTVVVTKSGFDPVMFSLKPSSPFQITVRMGQSSEVDADESFLDFYWFMIPRSSFIVLNNGTGSVNLTVGASDLEWWSLELRYNNTQLFFSNQTSNGGGMIDGTFNMTSFLGLNQTFNVTTHIYEQGFPSQVTAFFKFKRASEPDSYTSTQGIVKNYRLTETNRGLINVLQNINASPLAKGLIWMTLVMIVVAGMSFISGGAYTVEAGLIGVGLMGIGVYVDWLPLYVLIIACVALIGFALKSR